MKYISRADWRAIPMTRRLVPLRSKSVQGVVIHHTTGGSHDPAERVRGHDRYHVRTRGWSTIAYCWLIGAGGEIFEGRGWNVGGATKWWNRRSVSIAYVGSGDEVTDAALKSFGVVIAECEKRYGSLWLKNHRDLAKTYCPGNKLGSWVDDGCPDSDAQPVSAPWGGVLLSRRRRSRGSAVKAVQTALRAHGFDAGAVDGVFGRRTKAAAYSFQKSRPWLKPDGIVGANTWHALFSQ